MRTTLDIDDDVLAAAKNLARRERRSAGAVISELARRALTSTPAGELACEPGAFHGFRPLPRRSDAVVTNDLIDGLRDEEAY